MINIRRLLIIGCIILSGLAANARLLAGQEDSLLNNLIRYPVPDYKRGDEQCLELIRHYHVKGDKCNEVKALAVRSSFKRQIGKLAQAIGSVQQAELIVQQSTCKSSLLSFVYFYHALLYQFQKDTLRADSIARLGIRNWERNTVDEYILVKLYILSATVSKELKPSVDTLQKALNLVRKFRYADLELNALITMGAVYGS